MPKYTYIDFLLEPDKADLVPLLLVLKSNNLENLRIFMSELSTELKKITYKQRRDYLLKQDRAGFTPLHYAANSDSLELVDYFLGELKALLSPKDYDKALHFEAHGHKPSGNPKKRNASVINQRLESERKLACSKPKRIKYRYSGQQFQSSWVFTTFSFLSTMRRATHEN